MNFRFYGPFYSSWVLSYGYFLAKRLAILGTGLSVTLGLLAPSARAAEPLRPLSHLEFGEDELTTEMGVPVEGAEVAWANYELIRKDFPQIAHLSDAQISNWLIQNFAYLGRDQQMLDSIRQSPIPIDPVRKSRAIYRPAGWTRSGILEAQDENSRVIGMVDVKGIGHGARGLRAKDRSLENQRSAFKSAKTQLALDELRTLNHSDGLMSFGEGVAEVTRQQAAQKIFEKKNVLIETVESYAIIALPVQILKKGTETVRAALYLRQTHYERESQFPVPSEIYQDREGGRQNTGSKTSVDFGGVQITDPSVADHFGVFPGEKEFSAQKSKPWIWGHQVAAAFDRGDKVAVYRHIAEMLGPLGQPIPLTQERAAVRKAVEEKIADLRQRGQKISEIAPLLTVPESVLELAMHDRDRDVRNRAGLELQRTPNASLALLRRLMQQPDRRIREYAVMTLKHGPRPGDLELFKMAFADPEPSIRQVAASQIQFQIHENQASLVQIAFQDIDARVRSEALRMFRNKTDEVSLSMIRRGLVDPSDDVQILAFKILVAIDPIKYPEIFSLALKSHSHYLKRDIDYFLGGRKPEEIMNLVRSLPTLELRQHVTRDLKPTLRCESLFMGFK
jgi:hypothetical protein